MDINDSKTAVKRTTDSDFYDEDFDNFGECMKCGFIFSDKSEIHRFCPGCGRKITGIIGDKKIKLYPPFSDGDKKKLERVFAGIATIEEFQDFENKFGEQRRLFITYGENYNAAFENLTNALLFKFNNLFGLEETKNKFSKHELKNLVKEKVRELFKKENEKYELR